jgi:uncharacterized protein YceK
MMSRRLLPPAVVVVAAMLTLSGCGSKLRMTAKQMCEAHGGTYSAQGQTCDYTAQRRAAKQICEAHGGVYWPAEQYCELEAGR